MPPNPILRLYQQSLCQPCDLRWQPHADVYRTRTGWLVKLDLAGVRPEDVSVRLRKCGLTVSGIRRDWTVEDAAGHYLMEISYNQFERSIDLPCDDMERARFEMEFRDGILLVRLAL